MLPLFNRCLSAPQLGTTSSVEDIDHTIDMDEAYETSLEDYSLDGSQIDTSLNTSFSWGRVRASLSCLRNTAEERVAASIAESAPSYIEVQEGPVTLSSYFSQLDKWELKGALAENRRVAIGLIKEWIGEQRHCADVILKLDGLDLKSLPDLPVGVRHLSLKKNSFINLPRLPDALLSLDISDNLLSELSELPNHLHYLNVANNDLTTLPSLPDCLESLFVGHNRLTALPTLPLSLKTLNAATNQLNVLPELPAYVSYMDVSDNHLRCLPDLPLSLETLFFNENEIRFLPTHFPYDLRYIGARDNRLSFIPESLFFLNSDCQIFLNSNPLSAHTITQLHTVHTVAEYGGPIFYFSPESPIALECVNSLAQIIPIWYELSDSAAQPAQEISWQLIDQESYALDFVQFLERLQATVSFGDKTFRSDVAAWLDRLGQDKVLREHTFQIAKDALGSCEDRVTLTLNTMKKEEVNLAVYRGTYDSCLDKLVLLGRQMFRLDRLEKIAYEKVAGLKLVDEIAVYLAYQIKLREKLNLPIAATSMCFFNEAHITEQDLERAEAKIKEEEAASFLNYLTVEWCPWQSVLARLFPLEYAIAKEKGTETVEREFSQRQVTYLLSENLENNEWNRMQTAPAVLSAIAYEMYGDLSRRLFESSGR